MQRLRHIPRVAIPAALAILFATSTGHARDPLTAVESAQPLPNGTKVVSLQGMWEERPMQSDLVAGEELWNLPRVAVTVGMGGWSELTLTYDLIRALNEGPQSLLGGGSPRLSQKFRWTEQQAWFPALGTRVGFKWPAANEPFEVDSGDFALAILASWSVGGWMIDFNTGPAIYGDRFEAGTQNHTWVWNASLARTWEKVGLTLKQELLSDSQLASRWYEFWETESGPFERLQLATSLAWNVTPQFRLTARYERSLIDTGIRQGVGAGWEFRF